MFDYEAYKARIRALGEYPEKPLNRRLQLIVDAIPPGSTVLDVACGTGRVLKAISAKGCRGRGIDLSPPAVRTAQSLGLDVLEGDVDAFDEDRRVREILFARYDIVVFSKCLMYLKRKNDILRRLDANALIIFQDNPGYWRFVLGRCWSNGNSEPEGMSYCLNSGETIRIDSASALARWAASFGYTRFEKLHAGMRHRSLIAMASRPPGAPAAPPPTN